MKQQLVFILHCNDDCFTFSEHFMISFKIIFRLATGLMFVLGLKTC